MQISIYCDESSHLENDKANYMVLGAIWCESTLRYGINRKIRELKTKYNIENAEIKWTKVSNSKADFYLELVDLFFSNSALNFRGVIANKAALDHERFHQTHDEWYYKMYWQLFQIIDTSNSFEIYLDIKDTKSTDKVDKLHDILAKSFGDYNREIIRKIQQVKSNEVILVQLADLFAGALGYYKNNTYQKNQAKVLLINKISQHINLSKSSSFYEKKFNIFYWG